MVDISRINLGELDKENLEKVKLMLDISKIQQDIATSQVTIEKIRQDVEQSRATVEQMRLANDKYLAETEKLRKETQWFPYLQIITTILTGGVVVFLLTKLLQ